MSIQWTLIATVMYAEVAVVLLLVMPVISPQTWHRLFKSRFMQRLQKQAKWYVSVIIFLLLLFLIESIREMRKYSITDQTEHIHSHLDAEMQNHMKLFRAQRNFYISGFAFFLSFIIRRLINLLATQAQLAGNCEAAIKQAENATTAAKGYLADVKNDKPENSDNKDEIKNLNDELNLITDELNTVKEEKEAVKSKAESITKEYDRLLHEHSKLQALSSADKKHE